ncbi:MAG: transposase [Thermoleophilia bacterium]|nr:transposase [Thermoleophilia bacterium]
MGRPLRVIEPGGFYQVVSRGNFGQQIFFRPLDYAVFLDRAAVLARENGWVVYAYCLMPNHFHFLMNVTSGRLSRGVQVMNAGHSRMINSRYERTGEGHLFRNRFYAGLIERESHLRETVRYVVLNPKRAGLCELPEEWPWSSYAACTGLELGHPLLATTETLRLFGHRPGPAARAFREFIRDGFDVARVGRP